LRKFTCFVGGRCGSTTFAKACSHITNFSAAHESRSSKLAEERFNYPKNHIEVDNRLSWLLGRLDRHYGDSAIYCHLTREVNNVASSFTKRYSGGIIKSYRGGGIIMGLPENADPMQVSIDYCDTVNSNITHFLKDKSNKINISLENIEEDFRKFWNLIKAEGNYDLATQEFSIKHNATQTSLQEKRYLRQRVCRKLNRFIKGIPKYIREV